jgi:hypothetical protein
MYWEYILSSIYIVCFWWFIPHLSFISKSGLSVWECRLLVFFKIVCAALCAYYFERIFIKVDYMETNSEGIAQYKLLLSDPRLFFTDFTNDVKQYGLGKIFDTENSFWGYFRFVLVFKFLAFLNLISKGNFYLNSMIFSTLVFFGHIAFYRIYNNLYPGKKIVKIITCFFLPSVVLYTSCVHKDGFIFVSLGVASYLFFNFLQKRQPFNSRKVIVFICSLLCIFLFRNYVLVALLPAMGIAFLVSKMNKYKILSALGLYAVAALLFFMTGLFDNSLNLPAAVVKRKAAFALLEKGSTNLEMNELEPNFVSFVKNIPQAINHSLFRPYPNQLANKGTLAAALELYFYLGLILIFLIKVKKYKEADIHPFNIFGVAFFITMMLIIGFTIPNAGAIIRYRSLIWIFVLCPAACSVIFKRRTAQI